MPEGPEVKKMGKDLAKMTSGKTLKRVEIISGRYTKKPIDGFNLMTESLPSKIIGVGVHGKFLYILTSSGNNIWSTLGMTGQWSVKKTKHSRVQLTMEDNSFVYFNDQRNFGTLKFVYGPHKLKKKLEKLGPDMFDDNFTGNDFLEKIRKKDGWNITKVLMNQSIVAGVGNYIKAESLWLAGINPGRNVSDISDIDLLLLYEAIRDVMKTSYKFGGATFLTHKNFSGAPGDYSSRFLCYNRKMDAEGNRVIKTSTPDGRKTHWAPDKQK